MSCVILRSGAYNPRVRVPSHKVILAARPRRMAPPHGVSTVGTWHRDARRGPEPALRSASVHKYMYVNRILRLSKGGARRQARDIVRVDRE